jgi:hypothetical protein
MGGMPQGMQGGMMMGNRGGMGAMGGMPQGMQGGMMMGNRGGMGAMGGMPQGMQGGMGMSGGMGGVGQTTQPDEGEDITELKLYVNIPVTKLKKKAYGQYYLKTPYGMTLLVPTSDIKINRPSNAVKSPEETYTDLDAYKAEKKTEDDYRVLLDYTLGHFMLEDFVHNMNGLRKLNPNHPLVVAFTKLDAAMQKPVSDSGETDFWRGKLPSGGYKVHNTAHYSLLYREEDLPGGEKTVVGWGQQMEQQYRAFFYWFAMRQKVLPVPSSRLIAVLLGKDQDFAALGKAFGGPPVVADGFLARRYNLAVFSARRLNPAYQAFIDSHKDLWTTTGWRFNDLLQGKGKPRKLTDVLKGMQGNGGAGGGGAGAMGAMGAMGGMGGMGRGGAGAMGAMGAMGGMGGGMGAMGGMGGMGGRGGNGQLSQLLDAQQRATQELKEAQTIALAKAAIEHDSMVATVSYETTRQLIAATGLLPRNVEAPHWLLFGLGSFFQTPEGSWWAEVGMTSDKYFHDYRSLRDNGKLDRADPALEQTVTDGYFRSAKDPAAIQKARTMAWSMTYFLMREHLDEMLAYCQELSKMPRDMELSSQAMMACFGRAFGLADTSRRGVINRSRLSGLAGEWFNYMGRTSSENDNVTMESGDEQQPKKKKGRSSGKARGDQDSGE